MRYDSNHPGILEVERLRQHMPDENIHTRIDNEATALQERLHSGREILAQSHIDRLRVLEVARTYVGVHDIMNPVAQNKLVNVQKGLNATGQALLSAQWQRILDDAPRAKEKTSPGITKVQLGRTP